MGAAKQMIGAGGARDQQGSQGQATLKPVPGRMIRGLQVLTTASPSHAREHPESVVAPATGGLRGPDHADVALNLLVVGLNYAPEPVGIGPYTSGLTQALRERGHHVTAVVGQPYYPYWRRFAGFRRRWKQDVEQGVTVIRCPHYVPAEPTGKRRILHHLSFALSALLPALTQARTKPDVVLAVAPSLLSVPIARLAAWVAGAKLWIHVQDFEVEAAFATGLVAPGGWPARMARWLENAILRSADRVSTISPQMRERLAAKGLPPARTSEIRNWANHAGPADEQTGGNQASYRIRWGLGSRSVALYSGNIANKQGIEILIAAAGCLRHRDDLAFVICGQGPNRARLEALAVGLRNVQFQDLQPAERMGELLAMASVHLLPQIAGAADLVLPSKLTNMLASGRPVVATAMPGTGLAAELEGAGLVVPPNDAAALASAIVRLVDDPELANALGAEARCRAAERWSKNVIMAKLERELLDLAGGGSPD